ncbi:hypothetical protein [Brachybacterium sp. GU-2]|nr:hypothetical protein [Brachybacterium sp. GU-2]WME23334.1 hypothetical protein RBL05_00885 [Brachybacterium sp. GU-2]
MLAVGVVGFVGLVALARVPAGLMVPLIEAPYLAWLLWRSRV